MKKRVRPGFSPLQAQRVNQVFHDGIPSYAAAKARSIDCEGYRVASLRDIIASKRASNRAKDWIDLHLLEEFRREYEKRPAPPVETAAEKALRRTKNA